jgi:hypothetical protein
VNRNQPLGCRSDGFCSCPYPVVPAANGELPARGQEKATFQRCNPRAPILLPGQGVLNYWKSSFFTKLSNDAIHAMIDAYSM